MLLVYWFLRIDASEALAGKNSRKCTSEKTFHVFRITTPPEDETGDHDRIRSFVYDFMLFVYY